MKLVSIIIPVYNVSKYLNECLDSIVRQTYKNLEILLIDDGSTDDSGVICDNYSKEYSNIKVFHLKNSGVSAARNYGIEQASGDYLTFVDSDDVIDETMIEKLVNCMGLYDIQLAVCSYSYMYKDFMIDNHLSKIGFLSNEQTKRELFLNTSIRGFSVNKIFITNIIKKNNLKFDSKIKICEDLLFVFDYVSHIENVYVFDESLYYYRMRMSSASNGISEKDLTVFDAILRMNEIDNKVYNYMDDFYTYLYFKYYKLIRKKDIFKSLKKIPFKKLLTDKKISRKTKLYALTYLIFPDFIRGLLKGLKQRKYNYFE